MERHTRLSRAAVVLVAIALIAAIAAAVWFASPDAPYVPSEDSGAALGTAAPAEDGTVASGYQPSSTGTGISDNGTDGSAIQTIRNSGNGTYHLTDNIVVNSLTDCVFSGTFDGNGKTISIQYDSEETGEPDVDPTYVGIGALFGNLNGATIKNVKIEVKTFRYVEGSAGTRNVGIIAGDAWGGAKIENVYVELQYSPTSDGRSYFLDSGEHSGSWSGTKEVELNFGAVLGKSGSSEDAATDVTLKNVTVDNQTSGNYGFSAWIRHGDDCNYKVSMGHFVGWVTGVLSMQNCTLRGGESAKMTIKRGGSGGKTTNQSGAVIGRLDEQSGSKPSLTIAGLDMEMAINFGTYKVMNIDIGGNNGIIYGNDADNSCTVNVKDIYWNQNSGDPGWYDGDDQNQITYNNLTKYDPNTIGVSFDNDQIVLSAMSQYIDKAEINSITFNKVTYSVWDKLIATDTKAVGQWTQVVTVAKPNSNSGGSITYTTEMGTGTFTIEGGETITGVSGNSYTAEREYNGNAPQSPSIVLSSGGGSYADVWKTTNASANVGKYTMTFDKNAFTDAVVATGSDGLTYIAKNGIVYSPESMEQIGQLNIVNNINVNITKASVTVTPNVPDNDLYTGNRLPELTATAVDSGGKAVEGDIKWDDPDATLSSGTNSYAWTWTPKSDNYQTVKDSMKLEAFDRKIVSLTVQGDYRKEYTAYEPFDPTGVEVIAHYSDGSSEQLVNDEYEFTVMNGDKTRLIVGNDTVTVSLKKGSGASTTIKITVSKLAVDVPNEIQGLVYNGAEQIGVATSADNYYSLSGNTGTNARDYTATATLPDEANTRWNTAEADDTTPKEIGWSIAKKDVDIMERYTGKTYDGQVVEPTTLFTAQGVNDEELALTVAVDGGKTILNAGTYSVTASLAESETNYIAKPVTITYKVDKKLVSGEIVADNLVYDGTEKGATFNGQLIGEDKVEIKYAGDRMNVTEAGFTATANLPSDNYAWADDAAPSATFMISPKEITVTATSGSREFNWNSCSEEELRALFTLSEAVDYKLFVNDAEAEIADGQVSAIYDAKEYKIEIASASANYTLVGTTSTTYTITLKKVEKPIISDVREFIYNGGEQGFEIAENQAYEVVGDTKAIDAYDGYIFTIRLVSLGNVAWIDDTIGDITVEWKIIKATFTSVTIEFADGALDNLFTSSAMPTPTTITANPTPLPEGVKGKFEWLESSLSEDTNTYHWTYTVPNYNVFEGTKELTAQAARLDRIEANDNYKKDYTAYDFFDVDSLVMTAYFDNGNGEESRVLSPDEYTLQSQSNIAQEGVPQLVVGDTYVIVTYQDKSVQIPVTVTAKVIELPEVIEELTYTGEPQTPFDWRGAGYESYNAFFEELSSYSYCDPSIVLRTDAGDFTFTLTINDDLGNNVVFENEQKTFEVASKILPKRVYLGHGDYTWGWFYGDNPVVADLGGNTGDDVAFVRAYDEDGNLIKDSLAFVAEEKTGLEQLVDAKEYTLVFTLADSVKNYQADAYEVVVSVARKPVQATLTAPDSVVYTGKEINAILDVTTTLVGEDKVTVEYNDVDRIDYTGEEIVATAQLPNDNNYEWADGAVTTVSFTIQKATIDNVTVTISEAPGGVWTTAMMPELTVVSVEPHVGGEVVWDNDSLIAGENKEQPWTFVPDSPNYELYHGSVKLNVVQATLAGVSVEVVKTTEYVAFDAFDRSSIVVEALYGEGPKEITGYTLTFSGGSTEGRLLAGTGITVTVTYTDGDVTQYTEFTINVAKRTVAKPVVDTTVFDATGETITLPIAASEYYTVSGDNTASDPGRYVATVELKDPVNTMWADGTTEDVKIAWTITEPVTSGEVIADILAMEKVTWQNAEEFLDLEARYNALDESEQTAEATAKLEVLRAQYDALRNAAFDDIEAAHEVTAKSLGKALAAAAAGLSAAAIALAIAKRRSI